MISKLHLLVLILYIITACHAAIIPGSGDSSDLELDAADLLEADVLNSKDEDLIIPPQADIVEEEEEDDTFQHSHQSGYEKDVVFEDIHYSLNEEGRFVVVPQGDFVSPPLRTAASEEEAIQMFEEMANSELDEENLKDDPSILNSHSIHVASHEEEGEEIGEEEDVLFDNADDDSTELTIDPETGMPVFKNKNAHDFDFFRQIPVQGEENSAEDDGEVAQQEEGAAFDQPHPGVVIHGRPHLRVDPGKFYHHTPSRYQPKAQPKPSSSSWHLWKYCVGVAVLVFILVKRSSGAQMSSSEAIATHQDWRKQLNRKYDQARLPLYSQDGLEFASDPVPYKSSRRASAGHVRKPSAGSGRSQGVRLQHQRHTSLSSINTAAVYRQGNGMS